MARLPLTDNKKKTNIKGQLLAEGKNSKAEFKMSLERTLEKKFCFDKLQQKDIKTFNSFIERTVGKDFQEVNKRFLRKPDKNDKIDGNSVYHYEVSKKFRIHGYLNEGYFVICRVDPNHKFH